jgi:hypothetical protein
LSRAIAHQLDLPLADEEPQYTDAGVWLNVSAEAIGKGIAALRALRVGNVGVVENGDATTWLIYRDNLDSHGLTIEQVAEHVTGLSWTEAARLMMDAHATPIAEANPDAVTGTGGFVAAWLRPGDRTECGWPVPPTQHGMRLAGVGTEVKGEPADLAELGERMAMRWQSPLIAALSDLGGDLHNESERGFTQFPQSLRCPAVDMLAKVLALAGSFDTAAQIIAVHAEADDGDEAHAHIGELARIDEECTPIGQTVKYDTADAAARDYMRALLA